MASHSSVLAWRIPWTKKPGGLQSMGSQRVGRDSVTNTFISLWKLKIQPMKPKKMGTFKEITERRVISNLSHSFLKLTREKDSHVPVQKKKKPYSY